MKKRLPKYVDSTHGEKMALCISFGLHALFILIGIYWTVSAIALPQQQLIQVALVSPSVIKETETKEAEPVPKEIEVKTPAPEKPKAKPKEVTKNTEKKEKTDDTKKINPTAGQISKDATATNSAVTEPVFDAAYLHNTPPIYPLEARQKEIQGKVLLLVNVSKDGYAKTVEIARSSGSSLLDTTAKETVSKWEFIPAQQSGVTVDSSVIVPVIFDIKT